MKVLCIILGYLVIGALYNMFSIWSSTLFEGVTYIYYSSKRFLGAIVYDEDEILESKTLNKYAKLLSNVSIIFNWPVMLIFEIIGRKYLLGVRELFIEKKIEQCYNKN